jgi:TRAP-type C4-dicarboxylate transport system permease small subunit
MAKGKGKDKGKAPPPGPTGPDLGLVFSLSLFGAVVVTYSQWQGVIDGKVSAFDAAAWFLVAAIVCMIAIGMVAFLYHSYANPKPDADADEGEGEAEGEGGEATGATNDVAPTDV